MQQRNRVDKLFPKKSSTIPDDGRVDRLFPDKNIDRRAEDTQPLDILDIVSKNVDKPVVEGKDTGMGFWERAGKTAVASGLSTLKAVRGIGEGSGLGDTMRELSPGLGKQQETFDKYIGGAIESIRPPKGEDWVDIAADLVGETPSFLLAGGIAGGLTKGIATTVGKRLIQRGARGALTSFIYDLVNDKDISPEQAIAFAGIDMTMGGIGEVIKAVKEVKRIIPKNYEELFGVASVQKLSPISIPTQAVKEEVFSGQSKGFTGIAGRTEAAISNIGDALKEEAKRLDKPKSSKLFTTSMHLDEKVGELKTSIKNGFTINESPVDYPVILVEEKTGMAAVGKGVHADIIPAMKQSGMKDREIDEFIDGAMSFLMDDGKVIPSIGSKYTRKQLDKAYSVLKEEGYNEEMLGKIAPVKVIEKGPINIVKDGVEQTTSKKKPRLNQTLFGLAKGKGIEPKDLKIMLKEGIGINDLKFSGENAITEKQVKEAIQRLREISRNWTDEEKSFYMIHGRRLTNDFGGLEPSIDEMSSPIWEGAKTVYRKSLERIVKYFEKMGPKGNDIKERFLQTFEYKDRNVAQASAGARKASKMLSRKEWATMMEARESGTLSQQSDKIQEAFSHIGPWLEHIDSMAKKLEFMVQRMGKKGKVPYEGLGDRYWPRMFEMDWTRSGKKQRAILESIMKRNNLSRAEAKKRLEYLIGQRKVRRSSNLEFSREFDAGGWMGDYKSPGFTKRKALLGLERYYEESYRRISEAVFLDSEGKKLAGKGWKSLEELIAEEPSLNRQLVLKEFIKRIRGLDPPSMTRPFISMLKNIQIVRLLGNMAIANVFQPAITVVPKVMTMGITRGTATIAEGLYNYFSKEGWQYAREIGATAAQNMREVVGASSRGATGKMATGWLKLVGGSATEMSNNTMAATMGRAYIKRIGRMIAEGKGSPRLRKLAEKELREFGVLRPISDITSLTDDELATAAWRMARLTQFRGDPMSLPYWWSSPEASLAVQFKSFSLNIFTLSKDHFLKPAVLFAKTTARHPLDRTKWDGSILPLLTFVSAGIGTGEAIAGIRTALIGRKRPENVMARILEDVVYAGTLGLWMDILYATSYGKVLELPVGPTIGQAAKAAEDIAAGKPEKVLKDMIPRSIITDPFIRRKKKERKGW